jgi:iron complex outermembrane receptor protein
MLVATFTSSAGAQQPGRPDSSARELPPVVVSVTREGERSPFSLPFSVSAVRPDSTRPALPHLGPEELLFAVPGVFTASRGNPTQDARLSIRGSGARTAFGVRGVRILRDGIPLTVADGQTALDNLDLEQAGRVDVLRGSASSLYGTSSGGVIDIHSPEAPSVPLAGRASVQAGSYGMSRVSLGAGGGHDAWRYQGDVSRASQDGYRRHAGQRSVLGTVRLVHAGESSVWAATVTAHDAPVAENPGALTLAELRADRRASDPAQLTRATRKAASQWQVGATWDGHAGQVELSTVLHGSQRSLDNPLTFAVVDLDRATWGGGASAMLPFIWGGREHRVDAGIDAQWQDDDRLNFANCNVNGLPVPSPTANCPVAGVERGALRVDQRERIVNAGPYLRGEFSLGAGISLTAGARVDWTRFRVDDHLVKAGDPDDSGERTMRAFSPMVGLVKRLAPTHALRASYSSSFETPTTTELANQPDGSAGLNPELDPQRASTYEVGATGIAFGRVRYDIAVYHTATRDELVPFEVDDGSGRRFFRNAERLRRNGAEVSLTGRVGAMDLTGAWTWSDFEGPRPIADGAAPAERGRLPGIPRHRAEVAATWRRQQWFVTAEGTAAGSVFADDRNAVRVNGGETVNLRTGLGGWHGATIALGVHNLFDARYISSVVVNAAGGRYYEPSPGRTLFVRLSLETPR